MGRNKDHREGFKKYLEGRWTGLRHFPDSLPGGGGVGWGEVSGNIRMRKNSKVVPQVQAWVMSFVISLCPTHNHKEITERKHDGAVECQETG